MKEIMCADVPLQEREQILRDNCDKIVERSYTRKFDGDSMDVKKSELANVLIKMNELQEELKEIRQDYKERIKPLEERLGDLREEIKVGGEWVKGDCFLFIDRDENRAGLYAPDGSLIEERPRTKEERQKSIMEVIRTGTHD